MLYRFDQFELDTKQFSLRTGGSDIHIEPLVFDLLCFFVENAGKVLSRDAIIERVWKGRFVSDAAVSSCVKAVRKALGDDGENQNFIRTVRGRGFQFTAPVVSVAVALDTSRSLVDQEQIQTESSVQSKALAPPKIAVLPLFPLSQDPQLGLLGDAVAQEIILELSRLHWLFVIARGSSFQFRGQEVDLARASRILGARYFLTGTIMKEDAQLHYRARALQRAGQRGRLGRSHHHASARHHAHALNRCRKNCRGAGNAHPAFRGASGGEGSHRGPGCLGILPSRPLAHVPFQ